MKQKRSARGERIMVSLMNKLADKISAQEMIKANTAAETAERERMRVQLAQYQEQMEEIRKKSGELTEQLAGIGKNVELSGEEDRKHTHDIGVQIYRNVQACVREENDKICRELSETLRNENEKQSSMVSEEITSSFQRSLEDVVEHQNETDALIKELQSSIWRYRNMNRILLITLVISVAGVLLQVLEMFGIGFH